MVPRFRDTARETAEYPDAAGLPIQRHARSPIEKLTSKQRAHLRTLAHPLKPLMQVGVDGVTPSVVEAVRETFNQRELVKIKVLDGAPEDVDEAADALRDALDDVHVVQTIGRTMVLYRPDPDDPEIRLP